MIEDLVTRLAVLSIVFPKELVKDKMAKNESVWQLVVWVKTANHQRTNQKGRQSSIKD